MLRPQPRSPYFRNPCYGLLWATYFSTTQERAHRDPHPPSLRETRLQCPGPQSSTFRAPAAIFARSIFWRVDHTVSVHPRAQRVALCGQVWLEIGHVGWTVHTCSESSSRLRTTGAGKKREHPLPSLDCGETMRVQEFEIWTWLPGLQEGGRIEPILFGSSSPYCIPCKRLHICYGALFVLFVLRTCKWVAWDI